MRISGVPGLGRLMARLPPSERSVRMTFRQIGHASSLEDGRITLEDRDTYLALLRHTQTLKEDQRLAAIFVSWRTGLERVMLPSETLARVSAPTHFIWGERDPFGGLRSLTRSSRYCPTLRSRSFLRPAMLRGSMSSTAARPVFVDTSTRTNTSPPTRLRLSAPSSMPRTTPSRPARHAGP